MTDVDTVELVIENLVREVAELPDRTSPSDCPEMMLVSAVELSSIARAAIAALPPAVHYCPNCGNAHRRGVDRFCDKCLHDEPTTPDPVTEAAKVLLADDIALSRMSKAMHDGPLGADEHWFSAATEAGGWCLDCVRAALRALTKDGEAG